MKDYMKMIKPRNAAVWVLYYIGHIISLFMRGILNYPLYPLYSFFMLMSSNLDKNEVCWKKVAIKKSKNRKKK